MHTHRHGETIIIPDIALAATGDISACSTTSCSRNHCCSDEHKRTEDNQLRHECAQVTASCYTRVGRRHALCGCCTQGGPWPAQGRRLAAGPVPAAHTEAPSSNPSSQRKSTAHCELQEGLQTALSLLRRWPSFSAQQSAWPPLQPVLQQAPSSCHQTRCKKQRPKMRQPTTQAVADCKHNTQSQQQQ